MAYSFTAEQVGNAETIVRVGLSLGASLFQIRAALAAAYVESRWRNLNYGDRDSLGLFQQRPSMDWGSPAQVTNPEYAARAFFLGAGTNPGAFKVNNSGTPGQLAQRVQRSAFPTRYDEQIGAADEMLARFARNGGDLAAALARVGVNVAGAIYPGSATPSFDLGGVAFSSSSILLLLLLLLLLRR